MRPPRFKTMKYPRWFSQTRFLSHLRLPAAVSLMAAALVSAIFALPWNATGSSAPAAQPQVLDDSQMKAMSATVGGAAPLPTGRTVAHWFGTTLNPDNGVIYGYNMVGANPNNCSGSGCDVTVTVDITPVDVTVDGETFKGSDALAATLASPVFATNDYGSTPAATAAGNFPNVPLFIRGPGGALSQQDAGNPLQLQDATMRAQFNKTGSSSFHLRLLPVVHDTITIDVPSGKGVILQSGRGVHFADVNNQW